MQNAGLFYIQATAQPRLQIFAESDSKFFLKVVDAKIEFIKGIGNKATEMIIFQGGNEVHLKKIE